VHKLAQTKKCFAYFFGTFAMKIFSGAETISKTGENLKSQMSKENQKL
jgi:hypothetical protein